MAKRARKAKKPVPEPIPWQQAGVTFSGGEPMLDVDRLRVMEYRLVPSPFPPSYRSFLLEHNGGSPSPGYFTWLDREGEFHSHVYKMLGFDPRPMDDLSRGIDLFSKTLAWREWLPAFSFPIAHVDRDDALLLFVCGERKGQVWFKSWDEVVDANDKGNTREAGLYFVAGSFDEFVHMLKENPEAEAG